MDGELQRIANTLLLFSYQVKNMGLFSGKMGIIMFLYRYSKFVGNEYYSNFAGDMLDKVLGASGTVQIDFEDGLTGIGWVTNYLLKNGLLDGNVNEVLQNVDKKVFAQMICNPESSIFGQAIYLLERLKENRNNSYLEEKVGDILDICYDGLLGYKGKISLYHINSVLCFLIEVEKMDKYIGRVSDIIALLPKNLKNINEQRLFDVSDILIFDQILANDNLEQSSKWNEVRANRPQNLCNRSDCMELYIRNAWLQELYFGKINMLPPTIEQIKYFVDKKQESLTLDDFLFMKGLAGLGCALLSQKSCM